MNRGDADTRILVSHSGRVANAGPSGTELRHVAVAGHVGHSSTTRAKYGERVAEYWGARLK